MTLIVEATSWVVDSNMNVEFMAQSPQAAPHSSWQTPAFCPVSR
ncbi:MAG: hypothetical protein RMY28_013865 [Nostoc sp. ChiSLP01]|nr:hypothetical protein [Nostoc sp. CmiSLP01]MDZ8286504.1 hypothetical protein [Nostoc sp. ChiSLP01]